MSNNDLLTYPAKRERLKFFQIILGFLIILASFAFCVEDVYSENPADSTNVETKTNLFGTLIDSKTGEPISNALVSVEGTINKKPNASTDDSAR